MYCPNCKAEYRDDITECQTCKVTLVIDRPQEEASEYIRFVTAYETGDPAFISFAKSVLAAEGIPYYFKGEGLQDLFAGGRLGTGFNPLVGPVQIQVDEDHLEHARQLLKQIEEGSHPDFEVRMVDDDEYRDSVDMPGRSSLKIDITALLVGVVIGAFIVGAVSYRHFNNTEQLSDAFKFDLNGDLKPDLFHATENGNIVKIERDRNFDGQIDVWMFYDKGIIDRSESDNDFDGTTDTWVEFKNGNATQAEIDTNSDGEPEVVEYYKDGILIEQEWIDTSDKIIYKRAYFKGGVRHQELIDKNLDGKFDQKIIYNSIEQPISVMELK